MRFFHAYRPRRSTFLKPSRPCPVSYCPFLMRLMTLTKFPWGNRGRYVCPAGHTKTIDRHR